MITKGYHFPKLTCVGIIDADMTLRGGDLRASEKTYQILYQVAGRAGRSDSVGKVFLQTYFPKNETILSLAQMKRDNFYLNEINSRNVTRAPDMNPRSHVAPYNWITSIRNKKVIPIITNIICSIIINIILL